MRRIYSLAAISALSLTSTLTWTATATSASPFGQIQTSNKQIDELVVLCESAGDSDARFRCLLDQASRLNQAKNLARQRGERENGGVTTVETEPSMHGPSSEAPYALNVSGDTIEYTFTFRLRPRATTDYTQQAQVLVTYNQATGEWGITTLSNEAIAPTPCSYVSERQDQCF